MEKPKTEVLLNRVEEDRFAKLRKAMIVSEHTKEQEKKEKKEG